VFALEDGSPNRIGFRLERVMRTNYVIDDFQQTYFVIDGFEQLVETCMVDFSDVYARLRTARDYPADALVPGDDVLHRGTMRYFDAKGARP
jgi:phenylalanine-4-hydroxylase